ncbi:MAG: amidohydrolase family protein [Gemmatimonadetes bacterium]|nr:amidohydrolase family protein [Gemmatimonadota bacterium]
MVAAALAIPAGAQAPTLAPAVRRFVSVDAPVVAITHVRVIDGTGTQPREDQTVALQGGKIASIGPSARTTPPTGATIIDATGKSVMPGLVMTHEHLFYTSQQGTIWHEQSSFPRLYLGVGVTTARTGGSMHPIADLNIKKYIESGKLAGPKLDVTGPYINGAGMDAPQIPELATAADGRNLVAEWADKGATSFKAYMFVSREVLGAAIAEAHKRGLKVTGHLCSVTFREAAALGIDNLEHAIRALIAELVRRKVAITSTLAVFETFTPGRAPISDATLAAMSPQTREYVLRVRANVDQQPATARGKMLTVEMAFERAFVAAGGTLLAGTDPTGYGAAVAGYGNWRELELLVEAGFSPLEAITIATKNGATFLGRIDKVGTLAVGKQADLLLVNGNPAATIGDIMKLETVFKDGVGFDSAKLLASAKGAIGL